MLLCLKDPLRRWESLVCGDAPCTCKRPFNGLGISHSGPATNSCVAHPLCLGWLQPLEMLVEWQQSHPTEIRGRGAPACWRMRLEPISHLLPRGYHLGVSIAIVSETNTQARQPSPFSRFLLWLAFVLVPMFASQVLCKNGLMPNSTFRREKIAYKKMGILA